MRNRKGQATLVIALIIVVGLTIAISIASRSLTTVTISTQEEERARAFSAAEAGVEDALRQDLALLAGAASTSLSVGNASVSYQVTKLTNIVSEVDPGEVVTVDWSKSDAATSSFTVSWTNGICGSVSLVSTVITPSGGVTHDVKNSPPKTFNRGSGGIVRLRFVGCQSRVTVSGTGGALSFYQVDSQGVSGDSTTRVQVIRSAAAASGLIDFALFSGGDVQ